MGMGMFGQFSSSDTFVLLLSFETDINISPLFAIVGSSLRLDPPSQLKLGVERKMCLVLLLNEELGEGEGLD